MVVAVNGGREHCVRCLIFTARWLGGSLFRALAREGKVAVRLPASPIPINNSGQVVHTYMLLLPIWYRPEGDDALPLGR